MLSIGVTYSWSRKMKLIPELDGELSITSTEQQFDTTLRERVVRGFLGMQPGIRQQYEVIDSDSGERTVRATNWLTAINIGMNHLSLKNAGKGKLTYRLTYWRWTAYCVALGAILGLVMMVLFLVMDVREYIANNPQARIPGLTIDQNVYFAWGNIVFWGFVWPWILVAMHKRTLRKMVAKTISEIDATATVQSEQ